MTPERQAENRAHETLRDAIRQTSVANWDRRIAEGNDDDDFSAETRPEIAGGILVDYVVVALYDSGQHHTVMAVLRTDGECAQHRTVGLLHTALATL